MNNPDKEPSVTEQLTKVVNNPKHETDVDLVAPYPPGPEVKGRREDDQGTKL